MNDLTIIIISKDDSDVIEGAIKSAKKLTNEILIVDSNNDNKTELICKKLGVRVVKHPFKNFSDQRNFGISHATTKWVYYLDSDERITDNFAAEVNHTLKNFDDNGRITGFAVYRRTFYFGHDWHFSDKVERLFLRKKFLGWEGVVHESPKIEGEFLEIKSPIAHFTHRNLSQMVRKTNEWSNYEAYLRLKSNHPKMAAWRFVRVMASEFLNSFIKNKGYKNGTFGLIEAIYQSFSIFITYAKLWELQEASKNN